MKKRILSAFLVLCMMLTMVPTAALAAEDPGGGNGSDRVHTESNDGVEVDSNGQIVAYHIRSTYPFELGAAATKWARVEAYGRRTGLPNILHIMESERPDQYRGVSYLA